jgi:hypothetical protein
LPLGHDQGNAVHGPDVPEVFDHVDQFDHARGNSVLRWALAPVRGGERWGRFKVEVRGATHSLLTSWLLRLFIGTQSGLRGTRDVTGGREARLLRGRR